MRSCLVEVRSILIEYALELLLAEDQHVVEAFLSHTPHEAFADGIGTRCIIGGSKNLNRTRCLFWLLRTSVHKNGIWKA